MKEWAERKSCICRLRRRVGRWLEYEPRVVVTDKPWSYGVAQRQLLPAVQTCQQSFEEALHCLGIAPGLDKDVGHDAIRIHGPPKIVLHALDPDEDVVDVPIGAGSWPTPAQTFGEARCELLGDDGTTFRQEPMAALRVGFGTSLHHAGRLLGKLPEQVTDPLVVVLRHPYPLPAPVRRFVA